jgi:hypothetical protein
MSELLAFVLEHEKFRKCVRILAAPILPHVN